MSELDALIARVRSTHELALQQHVPFVLAQIAEIERRVFERMKAERERAALVRLASLGRVPTAAEIQAASHFGHAVDVAAYDAEERELLRHLAVCAMHVFAATAGLECKPDEEDGSTAPVGRIYMDRATSAADGRASLLNLTLLRRTIERSESVRRALPATSVTPVSVAAEEGTGTDEGRSGGAPLKPSVIVEITKKKNKVARHGYAVVRVDGKTKRDLLTVSQADALFNDAMGMRADKDLLSRARKRLRDEGIDPKSAKVREERDRSRAERRASPSTRAGSR